jgi:hypothetical protein
MMIAKLTYALVLFVHPDPEPRVYATFATAAECRAERVAVVQDLGSAQITAACVPQHQATMADIHAHLQEMMRVMRETMKHVESSGSKTNAP